MNDGSCAAWRAESPDLSPLLHIACIKWGVRIKEPELHTPEIGILFLSDKCLTDLLVQSNERGCSGTLKGSVMWPLTHDGSKGNAGRRWSRQPSVFFLQFVLFALCWSKP